MLRNPKLSSHTIFHYTSQQPGKRANAALLIGIYQIIMLNKTAEEVLQKFKRVTCFVPFCDASQIASSFELHVKDCLTAITKAISFNWYSLAAFDVRTYESLSQLEQGGLNWIIPGRVLAFVCPSHDLVLHGAITPERYVQVFKKLGVKSIIRLNNKTYESSRFTRHGFNFHELYFLDGSIPSEDIVRQFVRILETEETVAVHCKAGLGRTGTLIGCYVMKHFDISAEEFIAWCRMCRPGSILGPQQQFLCDVQDWCKRWGEQGEGFDERISVTIKAGDDAFKAKFGDYGQANRLFTKSNSSANKLASLKMAVSPILRSNRMEKSSSETVIKSKN